ncbi:DUF2057 family protein [Vibrio sp. SCSIO 43135]|uniref:DUF2057 family protein n=1 Tax=Vibrio paucivorans TaxID=2829489 RepID=A0A9X3CBS1_9VIBR|nr:MULTISPECIES: DUF2057 family protein [Vibrio]MCW8332660.1 DUF2057 family protein [Vibrio paucivorans]USD41859.1 DUF2057 family protein [Vibrio sp. SCSIO 43135]
MQKTSIVLIAFTLSACSSLDSNSDFVDAVETIKDRKNYVEIVAKDLTPDFKAVAGPNVMRSTLALTANFPKSETKVPESFISFEVSYFQNYDEYETVTYNGTDYKIKALEATKNSCNEHCTTTQYVSFPIDVSTIEQSAEDGLVFTMTSAGKRLVTDFEIPAGYFNAVVDESERYLATGSSAAVAAPVAVAAPAVVKEAKPDPAAVSKPQEMVEYWYQEASDAEKQQFTDWAFQNRKGDVAKLSTDSQSAQMMSYWFGKAGDNERKQILTWLLSQ